MALLQIHDPSAAPTPIGIDLGTTNSLVAYVTSLGEPTTILDCDSEALVPSVVHYAKDGRVIVGRDAQKLALVLPKDTLMSVKRFMGRGADDAETRRLSTYQFAKSDGPVVKFEVGQGRVVTPIEVSAEILRTLKENAEDELGRVGGAVITVPAYFDDAQRQATKDAGKLAGLNVLRLLNEPTAAALAYGLDSKKNGTFIVFDLGGGTFDVTVLSLDDGVFQVRSTGGDTQLGGDDMDRALAHHVFASMQADASSAAPELVRAILDASRAIKHALTANETVEADIDLPGGKSFAARVTRPEFDALIKPIIERTGPTCRRALRDAGIEVAAVDGVILVGGATRVPLVREFVTALFEKEPLGSIDPDQVVALGAAIQADLLAGSGPRDEVLLLDVLPLSLGVETMGGVVERILARNTAIPAGAKQVFTTYADNQTGFELHVVQGERDLAIDCRSLAHFTLKGIPAMPAGMARLAVSFEVDADGLLKVSAREESTGIEQSIDVKPSYGLSDDAIEKMLLTAYEHGEADVATRALREQQVEAARILAATKKAVESDAALLEGPEERARIDAAVAQLEAAVKGTDHRAIAHLIESLDETASAFAGRRMDLRIRQALTGRSVKDVADESAHAQGIEAHLGNTK
ncbi:MAG: Fe-S protein assembly chaperone HscA [Sandaracinaceae bacterium]|nr:Fe-S protein assembly chaperone HscA [Sandaracinaceae bacterium]